MQLIDLTANNFFSFWFLFTGRETTIDIQLKLLLTMMSDVKLWQGLSKLMLLLGSTCNWRGLVMIWRLSSSTSILVICRSLQKWIKKPIQKRIQKPVSSLIFSFVFSLLDAHLILFRRTVDKILWSYEITILKNIHPIFNFNIIILHCFR